MKIELTVNGLKIQAQYQNEEIENVHKPLLRMLAGLRSGVRWFFFALRRGRVNLP